MLLMYKISIQLNICISANIYVNQISMNWEISSNITYIFICSEISSNQVCMEAWEA